jgi:NADPH:quinone reductase-like Zn-dependent oxidoreductase
MSTSIRTHTAIATVAKGIFDAIQVPTEQPGPGEILLKTEYSSMIALDTYMADLGFFVRDYPVVVGFNASGIVHEVGPEVNGLAVGDRVSLLGLNDLVKLRINNPLGYSLCIPGFTL